MKRSMLLLTTVLLLPVALVGCDDDVEMPMHDNGSDHMEHMGEMFDGGASGETGGMPRWMMSRGMGPGMMADMRNIHTLLARHDTIDRQVENIPGGVRTVTASSDPQVAEALQRHVAQMKQRMQRGQPIRMMDPLFRELFAHADEIDLQYEPIDGGIRATHTSENPQVVLLIRQHARDFVNEVAAEGMSRAMQPTPLPEGYRR